MSRETGNKKHKVRRTFIATTIISAVAAIGCIISTAVLSNPILWLSEMCFTVFGASAIIGAGVGINAYHSKRKISGNRKASINNLQKIAENDLDLSKEQKIKIVKKYAKANLKLCKLLGSPLCGKFHSISGMQHEKETEAFNALENIELLQSLETTDGGRKKWESKIKRKRKIIPKNCLKSDINRWKKSYDNFIDGISIYDRRTEIACLSSKTSTDFIENYGSKMPTDEIGASVIINFLNSGCRTQNTYARIADPMYVHEVSQLMLKDVYYACEGKTQQEINSMFPFAIRSYTINKKSTDIENKQSHLVEKYSDLKNLVDLNNEHIR